MSKSLRSIYLINKTTRQGKESFTKAFVSARKIAFIYTLHTVLKVFWQSKLDPIQKLDKTTNTAPHIITLNVLSEFNSIVHKHTWAGIGAQIIL